MKSSVQVQAYAKINAYLDVTGRREDGYHTIVSHMQAVTLCDRLTLVWHPLDGALSVVLSCNEPSLSVGEDNLVCRAARALATRAAECGVAVGGELCIQLEKNIPMAAGLAGGSADAAATLRGFNELLGSPFSTDELCEIAVRLGADVPFCVRCVEQPAMTARGIGEMLTPAMPLPKGTHLVIACHGEGVSTPWAYRRLDEMGLTDAQACERAYAAFLTALASENVGAIAAASRNDFTRVVAPEREAVAKLILSMEECGAAFARMSGSGPSVVGYFEDGERARACAKQLLDAGVTAHVCRPL